MMRGNHSFARTAFILFLAAAFLTAGGCAAKKPTNEADWDVIVVGGGMGGLSAAVHAANGGLKVLLLEQHHKVGGCATSFTRDGFTFDTSLHEMSGGGPGKLDRGLYQLLKVSGVLDKVELIELPEFYRSVYPGGLDVTMPNNWEGWDATLKEKWPEEAAGIDKFHALCSGTMADLLSLKDLFRYSGFKAFFTKAQVPFKQKTFFEWKGKTLQELMDTCFTNEDIKAVVSQLWVYYGAPVPDEAALELLMATDSYLGDGIWHVKGTSQALSNAYAERIRELGGEVKTGELVTSIIITDGMATGVETSLGNTYSARYVVANTDPYQLVFTLVGEDNFPKKYVKTLKELKPANSLFGVYLGLNIDLAARGYKDTEIFCNSTKDSRVEYDNMMKGDFRNGGSSITIYSNYPDPIYAPPGKSVVVLHAYSDYDIWPKDQDEYLKMKDEKADELIGLAAHVIPEIADPRNIAVMEVITPLTLAEFTKNYHGVVYGFYLTPQQWFERPSVQTPIDNLFLASNWCGYQGHGVGPNQINGWSAARLIMDREGIE